MVWNLAFLILFISFIFVETVVVEVLFDNLCKVVQLDTRPQNHSDLDEALEVLLLWVAGVRLATLNLELRLDEAIDC